MIYIELEGLDRIRPNESALERFCLSWTDLGKTWADFERLIQTEVYQFGPIWTNWTYSDKVWIVLDQTD